MTVRALLIFLCVNLTFASYAEEVPQVRFVPNPPPYESGRRLEMFFHDYLPDPPGHIGHSRSSGAYTRLNLPMSFLVPRERYHDVAPARVRLQGLWLDGELVGIVDDATGVIRPYDRRDRVDLTFTVNLGPIRSFREQDPSRPRDGVATRSDGRVRAGNQWHVPIGKAHCGFHGYARERPDTLKVDPDRYTDLSQRLREIVLTSDLFVAEGKTNGTRYGAICSVTGARYRTCRFEERVNDYLTAILNIDASHICDLPKIYDRIISIALDGAISVE